MIKKNINLKNQFIWKMNKYHVKVTNYGTSARAKFPGLVNEGPFKL